MTHKADATVFVVDDDADVREALSMLLRSVGLKVDTFASAQAFLDAYNPDCPGCLVLDVRMPGMSGLELQETLRGKGITLPVIIMTGHGDVPMAIRAMKAGVMDFIEKPFNDQLLLDRVNQALIRDGEQRRQSSERLQIQARLRSLTAREKEVCDLIIGGEPNKLIARRLNVSVRTVEQHRARIMQKMQAKNLAELVTLAQRASVGMVG